MMRKKETVMASKVVVRVWRRDGDECLLVETRDTKNAVLISCDGALLYPSNLQFFMVAEALLPPTTSIFSFASSIPLSTSTGAACKRSL